MMGGCVLRTASGNVTEYLQVKGEPDEWAVFSNCTDRSCLYGLHNDSQVCHINYIFYLCIFSGNLKITLLPLGTD
jgi:hypothetical protein